MFAPIDRISPKILVLIPEDKATLLARGTKATGYYGALARVVESVKSVFDFGW
jgi:hypothetical protein